MLVIKRKIAMTKRTITIVAFLGAGLVLGMGLLMYLTEDHDVALAKVLKLEGRGRRVAWSPDGKTLAVVMIYEPLLFGKKEFALQLWDVDGENSTPSAKATRKGLWLGGVVFSCDGQTIATTVTDPPRRIGNLLTIENVVKLWDAKTLALKQTLASGEESRPHCLAYAPDGKLLIAGDPGKRRIELRNAETGSLERTLATGEAQPWSIVFSPDGKTLVVGGQVGQGHQKGRGSGLVQLWDAQTWTLKHVLNHESYVNTVAISANGKLLASGGGDEFVQAWDVQTGTLIHSLKGVDSGTRSVAFSPDSQAVAAGGTDGNVRLWDVQTGNRKKTLKEPGWGFLGASEVYSVAFSPDGKILASASQDRRVCLWKMP